MGYPGSDVFVGLGDYLRLEGMAYRICPVPQRPNAGGVTINDAVMEQCLMTDIPADVAYREPHYGFKFRNLNNSGVYYDEPTRNYLESYRRLFLQYAAFLLEQKRDTKRTVAVLDRMNAVMSPEQFPINYIDMQNIAEFYWACGALDKAQDFARRIVERTNQLINNPDYADYEQGARSPAYSPYIYLADAYALLGRTSDIKRTIEAYKAVQPDDPRIPLRLDLIPVWELLGQRKYQEALSMLEQMKARYEGQNNYLPASEVRRLILDVQLLMASQGTT